MLLYVCAVLNHCIAGAEMLMRCNYIMSNNNMYGFGPGVTVYNITIKGYNETVGFLAPGSTFKWQQVYPITTADMYETYVNVTPIVRGYLASGRPCDLPAYPTSVWLPVQHVVDIRLTPTLQPPSKGHESFQGSVGAFAQGA